MIAGLGLDIVSVPDFAARLNDPFFVEAVYTPREQAYCRNLPGPTRQQHGLAGRFAAKEAYAKALAQARLLLGSGPVVGSLTEIEVVAAADGPPRLVPAAPFARWQQQAGLRAAVLSISHDGPVAAAVVLLELSR